MFKVLLSFLVSLVITNVSAQVFPGEGDVVNYRLVGFTVPVMAKAEKYLFEVSEYGVSDKGKTFSGKAVEQLSDSHRTIIMLPHFNKGYVWRVSYLNRKGKIISKTQDYHFRTGDYPTIDTGKFRLRVIDSATHHDDIYVILDFVSVIYDLKGNPIWYLPDIPLVADKNMQMRDLKPNKSGSFTAVSGGGAYEFNYNGKLLWTAPNDGKVNGDTSEYYHHEFNKLSNGNYMVAGLEYVLYKIPNYVNKESDIKNGLLEKKADGHYYKRITTGNLIEYNPAGKVVWHWKSTDHFTAEDFFHENSFGLNTNMHLNAFDFDEENKVIYMSFRNTNEIVKIDYPSGKILSRYGKIWINDSTPGKERLFYGQHCVVKGTGNSLYLYNNNTTGFNPLKDTSINPKIISYINIFEETSANKTGLNTKWTFSCDIDTETLSGGGGGGSVYILDDKCILASMGIVSRIFIVSPDKKIIWNALPESADANKNWTRLGQYRTSFISKKDLEKLIFPIK